MRRPTNFIGLVFILVIIQCSRQTNYSPPTTETNQSNTTSIDTAKKTDSQDLKSNIIVIVKDSTQYSRAFLAGLRGRGPGKKFELIDDVIITDDQHKSKFIQLISKDKTVVLRGQKNGKKYELKLQGINYTTVSYEFLFTDENGELLDEQGIGEISPDFMLGAGLDEDDRGIGYGISSEYWTNDYRKSLSSIRLGVVDKKVVGRINGQKKEFTLEEAPFLK